LKGRFSFRTGTTSYIVPADIISNVTALAGYFDDIEIVLFESHETSDLPGDGSIRTLETIANDNALTYTIHLPIDTRLGCSDETVRKESVAKCLRVITHFECLAPFAYVIHFDREYDGDTLPGDITGWTAKLARSAGEILSTGVNPNLLCVETLSYPFELVEEVLLGHDLSVCLDIGHILLCGYPLETYLDSYLGRARVIHLHGIADGKDHCDISTIDQDVLSMLFSDLCEDTSLERVLTLELFNETDLETSLQVMETFTKCTE